MDLWNYSVRPPFREMSSTSCLRTERGDWTLRTTRDTGGLSKTALLFVKDTEVWSGFDSLRGQKQLDVLHQQRQVTQGILFQYLEEAAIPGNQKTTRIQARSQYGVLPPNYYNYMTCQLKTHTHTHVHQRNRPRRFLVYIFIKFIFYFLSEHWSWQSDKVKSKDIVQQRLMKVEFNSSQSDSVAVRFNSVSSLRDFGRKIFNQFQPNYLISLKAPCCAGNAQRAGKCWHQNANTTLSVPSISPKQLGGAANLLWNAAAGNRSGQGINCVRGPTCELIKYGNSLRTLENVFNALNRRRIFWRMHFPSTRMSSGTETFDCRLERFLHRYIQL